MSEILRAMDETDARIAALEAARDEDRERTTASRWTSRGSTRRRLRRELEGEHAK